MKRPLSGLFRQDGFSLIEIAIVLVIIGILAGGGISLLTILTERKARNGCIDYLKVTKEALISYAGINGRLPWADTDGDGNENANAPRGTLPYLTLNIMPADPYKRALGYEMNSGLGNSRSASCSALKGGLSGNPAVVDADGATAAFRVAAVLVSAGRMDADSDGNVFDDVTRGPHRGDNTDGRPNYIRHPPINGFDDMVTYLSGNELYSRICGNPVLSVTNNSALTVYVRDVTEGNDLCSLNPANVFTQHILPGTTIGIWSAPNGGGSIVPTTPLTPIVLSGNGRSIDVP